MRKKFFAVYALVGALVASPVFTSCIDDNESASVTAVRNAKAEQIKAQTEINKANAEYDRQMNELNLAIKQLQLESQEMSVEQQKIEFEKIQAQTEQAIVTAQYNIAYYTKMLIAAQDDVLTELTGNYTGALDDVTRYKKDIVENNRKIAALENGLIDIDETIANDTKLYNDYIAAAEAKIAIWKDAEGSVDKEEIAAEIATLEETINKLNAEKAALEEDYNKLATVLAKDELDALNGYYLVDGNNYNLDFVTVDENDYAVLNQKAVTVYNKFIAENLADTEADITGYEKDLALAIAALGTEEDKKDTKYVSGTDPVTFADIKALTKYAELADAKENLTEKEKAYTEKKEAFDKAMAEKAAKANALVKAQDDLAAEQAKTTPDATKVAELDAAVTEAQTAYNTAEAAYATAEAAYTPTVAPYEAAVALVNTKEIAIAEAKDNINSIKNDLADAKEDLDNYAEFETWVAAFEGDAYAAYKAAKDAKEAKATEISEADAEKTALNTIYTNNDLKDIESLIAEEEENIEGWKEDIAELADTKALITEIIFNNGNSGSSHQEFTKAQLDIIIPIYKEIGASLEAKLELAEARAEQAKAALDAYLGTEEGEEA